MQIRSKTLFTAMSITISLGAGVGLCAADTINVPSGGDIQAAIDNAVDGDVIQLYRGTYYPDATIDTLGKAITLRGVKDKSGKPVSVIDGQESIRVLQCLNSEGADTVFDSLTIVNGHAPLEATGTYGRGGGLRNENASPTVISCVFENNKALFGGGVYNNNSSHPAIDSCVFRNNAARGVFGVGGGVSNVSGSDPTVTNSLFEGNTAFGAGALGAGMSNLMSSPIVTDCVFIDNVATDTGLPATGGGIDNRESNAVITNCTFTGNRSEWGGAVFNLGGAPTLQNCDFEENLSLKYGGAIKNYGTHTKLINNTFKNNAAAGSGGGIYNYDGDNSKISDSHFCGNEPENIYNEEAPSSHYQDGGWEDLGGNEFYELCSCPGDFNSDGQVNASDLLIALTNWGNPYNNEHVSDVLLNWNSACE